MLRSFLNLLHLDPGFRQEHVLTASLSLLHAQYNSERTARFYDQLTANLSALPGVENAGAGSDLPWTGYDENLGGFIIEGKKPPPNQEFHARFHLATSGYFSALGIPLLEGRFFTEADKKDAPMSLIINRAMADRYWLHEDVIGKRISFEDVPKKDSDWTTIVGVVGDVKDQPNSPGAEPAFWWSALQRFDSDMLIVIRTYGDPALLPDALRDEVHKLDPALAVADMKLMDKIVDTSVCAGGCVCGIGHCAGGSWRLWRHRVHSEPANTGIWPAPRAGCAKGRPGATGARAERKAGGAWYDSWGAADPLPGPRGAKPHLRSKPG
jgi:hypothetical protein